jgi:hypothetical protein
MQYAAHQKKIKPLLRPVVSPLETPPAMYLPPLSPTPSDEAEDMVRVVCMDKMMDHHRSRMDKEIAKRVVPGAKTLIARCLPRDVSMQQIRGIFCTYGPLTSTSLPHGRDPYAADYGVCKGYAHIAFMYHEDAVCAFHALYQQLNLRGQHVDLEFARQ